MTKSELRETKEYKEAVETIKGYSKGFVFLLKYAAIPKAKGNALRIIMKDCIDNGILESVGIGLNIRGDLVEEEYKRI